MSRMIWHNVVCFFFGCLNRENVFFVWSEQHETWKGEMITEDNVWELVEFAKTYWDFWGIVLWRSVAKTWQLKRSLYEAFIYCIHIIIEECTRMRYLNSWWYYGSLSSIFAFSPGDELSNLKRLLNALESSKKLAAISLINIFGISRIKNAFKQFTKCSTTHTRRDEAAVLPLRIRKRYLSTVWKVKQKFEPRGFFPMQRASRKRPHWVPNGILIPSGQFVKFVTASCLIISWTKNNYSLEAEHHHLWNRTENLSTFHVWGFHDLAFQGCKSMRDLLYSD